MVLNIKNKFFRNFLSKNITILIDDILNNETRTKKSNTK